MQWRNLNPIKRMISGGDKRVEEEAFELLDYFG
jgi:hypothetical protein